MVQVHFEIFRQHGKSGGWALVEAMDDRAAALKSAKAMMEGDLRVEGDFEAAGRLGEMFGQDSLV